MVYLYKQEFHGGHENDLIRNALFYSTHLRGKKKIKQNSQSRNILPLLTSAGSPLKNQIKIKQRFQNQPDSWKHSGRIKWY